MLSVKHKSERGARQRQRQVQPQTVTVHATCTSCANSQGQPRAGSEREREASACMLRRHQAFALAPVNWLSVVRPRRRRWHPPRSQVQHIHHRWSVCARCTVHHAPTDRCSLELAQSSSSTSPPPPMPPASTAHVAVAPPSMVLFTM
jgi:hypothetical protein